MKENGLSFSEEKTQFQIITPVKAARDATIRVNGVRIHHSPNVKYLGVTFNENLSWRPHFFNIGKKIARYINLLKIIGREHWAKGTKFLVDVARSLVRSVCSYGQECFFAARAEDLDILTRYEYRALRVVLGVLPNTSGSVALYREAGWLTLNEERRLRCAQYVVRTARVSDSLVRPVLSDDWIVKTSVPLSRARKNRFGDSIQSIWDYTKGVLGKAGVTLQDVETKIETLPASQLPEIICCYTLKKGVKKSDDLNAAGADANIFIAENFTKYFQVYTDGSVQSDGRTGHGVVFWDPDKGYSIADPIATRDRDGHCTMTVELSAILTGLIAIALLSTRRDNVILTDSLSSLQALSGKPKNCYALQDQIKREIIKLRSLGKQVTFCHVPSHTSVEGNNRADTAANAGAKLPNAANNFKLTRKEAYRLINNACRTDEVNFEDYAERFKDKRFKGIYPAGPKEAVRMYRRVRLRMPVYRFYNQCNPQHEVRCPHCAGFFGTEHIFENPCAHLKKELEEAIKLVTDSGLSFDNLIARDCREDWTSGFAVIERLFRSSVAHLI